MGIIHKGKRERKVHAAVLKKKKKGKGLRPGWKKKPCNITDYGTYWLIRHNKKRKA